MELSQQKKQIIFKTCFVILLLSISSFIIYNLIEIINYISSYGEFMETLYNDGFAASIDYHNREFPIHIAQLVENIIFLILVFSNFALLFLNKKYLKIFMLFDILSFSIVLLLSKIVIQSIYCHYLTLLLESSICIICIMIIILIMICVLFIPQIIKEIKMIKSKTKSSNPSSEG